MQIKNVTIFFLAITVIILGSLVIIFDHIQIQYFEKIEYNAILEMSDKDLYQRLKIEYTVGWGILTVGIAMMVGSIIKKSKVGDTF